MRLLERLDELYAIGGGPGANRIGYSSEEDAAHTLARGWMEQVGLELEVDAVGNLVGRSSQGSDVWAGSHLDSVPGGGRYDGALGVVAAIEAVERTGRGAVVVFRDEERGCAGSRGRVRAGSLPRVFLEVHVEQAPRLERAGAPLGIVTGIAGIAQGEVVFEGSSGHAGTVPLELRRDALVAAAEHVLRVRRTAETIDGALATVGRLEVEPGALNVIPGRVRLGIDARAASPESFERLLGALELEPDVLLEPVAMAPELRAILREEVERRDLPVVELASGAGHDAGVLAAAGVPCAMLFVRSLNGGASHSPEEWTSDEDAALAVEVLAAALARV